MYISTNNGTNWSVINNGITCTNVWSLAIQNNKIFAGTQGQGLFVSANTGNSWTAINTGISNPFNQGIVINGNDVFVGTNGDGIYMSTNNGNSWDTVNAGLGLLGNVVTSIANKDSNIYVGTWGISGAEVYKYSYITRSWIATNLTNNIPSIESFAFKGDTVYFSTGNGRIFWTSDKGINWTKTNDISTCYPTIKALITKGNNIYAGSNGVNWSSNNGISWHPTNITATIVSLFVVNNKILAGAENMEGVFLSIDNGYSWIPINWGLPAISVTSFAADGTYIYMGTYGAGVWKRPISELTGIEENIIPINIVIYPNPTSNILTIETNCNINQRLEITNLIGQTIYTSYFNKKATIDVSHFPKGIYILKLNTDKGIEVKKFVKE